MTTTQNATAALDAEVLALIASASIATHDGNGDIGPKGLAWAMRRDVRTIRASIRRLQAAQQIIAQYPHGAASTAFWTPTA